VAVAAWDDAAWDRLATLIGIDDASLATLDARKDRIDEVEAAVAMWTSGRSPTEAAEAIQALAVEAVPVADFGDVFGDLQLAARDHFIPLDHAVLGPGCYEHNGFRLSDAESGYDRPSPTLGQHTDVVLGDILGLTAADLEKLAADGALD
jgi:crotonobetainyl-CoA:carnitine CoA-transferase CaiB-like acyl-CoA transferase